MALNYVTPLRTPPLSLDSQWVQSNKSQRADVSQEEKIQRSDAGITWWQEEDKT